MDIRKQSSEFYRIYDDKKEYYLKNLHDNILVVSKPIIMERFGYIFTRAKDTPTEDFVGVWKKKLPADEGFEVVAKEDWQKLENERLGGITAPAEKPKGEPVKMGPDEGKFIKAEAEAKAKAEAAKLAEAEAGAKKKGKK